MVFIHQDRSNTTFALSPPTTLKAGIRQVHIAIRDVVQPSYQSDIAAAFGRIMEKEARLDELEASLSQRQAQPPLTKLASKPTKDANCQGSQVRPAVFDPAMRTEDIPNKPVTGRALSKKFTQAYRKSANHLPESVPSAVTESVPSNSQPGRRVSNPKPPTRSAKQFTEEDHDVKQLCLSDMTNDSETDREPGEIALDDFESDQAKEEQDALLNLVDWLLGDRADLQLSEARAKKECKDL